MDLGITVILVLGIVGSLGFEVGRRFPNRRGVVRALNRMDRTELGTLVAELVHRWGLPIDGAKATVLEPQKRSDPADR